MKAVIRIRGSVKLRHDVKRAMSLLNLEKINHLVLVPDLPQYLGQLRKARDYITFGDISVEVLEKLLAKRARLEGDKKISMAFLKEKNFNSFKALAEGLISSKTSLKELGVKLVFRLHPPKKGFERQGIKKPFAIGGALGDRREEINTLILRMI